MQITIDIPDQLITEALDAATLINQRLPAQQRQPEPLTFGVQEAGEVITTWLTNLILTDLAQSAQVANEKAANDKRAAIQAIVTGTP
jgi:hypothetical protein